MKNDVYGILLLDLAIVLVAARLGAWAFARLHQPPVIGEVIAGILLGPTLLGGLSADLFPLEVRPLLRGLATLAVVLFMFVVGLEVDRVSLKLQARMAGVVSVTSIAVPFALGVALGFALRPYYPEGDLVPFVLFLATAMSITAFPVLTRILIDNGLSRRPLGVMALAAAAVDDLLAWIMLATVVSLVSSDDLRDVPITVALTALLGWVLIVLVRPRLRRFADADLTPTVFSAVVAAVFLCAFLTSAIGVHEIFGAFLFGLIFPRGSLAVALHARLETMALVLLPVFFVVTGLNVDVSGIGVAGTWQLLAIIAVAFCGKFGGAFIGSRSQGIATREAMGIGALMNTRGLAELIVLAVGRELGVIDDTLYGLLVVMAIVTTVATGPLLHLIKPDPDLPGGTRRRPPGVLGPDGSDPWAP